MTGRLNDCQGQVSEKGVGLQRVSFGTTKVLYILGLYRSGTTLLGNLLGQLEGFGHVGELRATWREIRLDSNQCGCGLSLRQCDLWRTVIAATFRDERTVLPASLEMEKLQASTLGGVHTWSKVAPLLLRRPGQLSPSEPLGRYGQGMVRLYQTIADVSGARVIVDSSKEPTDAALLRLLPQISPYFVHIVRDPRGVVYSGLRKNTGRGGEIGSQSWQTAYTALSWTFGNMAAAVVRRAQGPKQSLLLRYEDLMSDPAGSIRAITKLVGEDVAVPDYAGGRALLSANHTVCGNDNRFRIGTVQLTPDLAWRASLHRLDRTLVTALCSPLLGIYHYDLRS